MIGSTQEAADDLDHIVARSTEPALVSINDYIATNGSSIGDLVGGKFAIRTLSQAERLSTLLACHCPDPERVAPGIWELLSNAIEHGNLAITFDEKTQLLRDGNFHIEVERRLDTAAYRDRRVHVEFERKHGTIRIVITDEGAGFDYKKALRRKLSLSLPNGRGIAIASKLSFDELYYRGRGNCVEAILRIDP